MGWRDRAVAVTADAPAAPEMMPSHAPASAGGGWRERAEPVEPTQAESVSGGTTPTTWSQKLGEGAIPGFNRIAAAAQAATDPVVPGRTGKWGGDFATRYREHLAANQGQSDRTQAESPYISAGLQTVGAIPSALALGAPAGAARSAIGGGAMYAAGDTRSDTLGGQAKDIAMGGSLGLLASRIPGAMLATENAARSVAGRLLPRVTPTPAAQTLMREGVPLTVGQMAGPDTAIGQFEAVSANGPLGMAGQREAAEQAAMRVMQNKGVAPGAQPPKSTDLQTRLRELFSGFQPIYDKIRSQPIPADAIEKLRSAAAMPGRGVDARTAAGVKAEVENALTVLGIKPSATPHTHGHGGAPPAKAQGLVDQFGRDIPPPPAAPMKATAGDLMKVRENIREQVRAARQAQDFDRLRLLEGAEDVVTEGIEAGLDPASRTLLQQADRQYARLMTAANAAPAGQTGFTPLQYLKQVEKGAGRRAFKTGGAGDLQDLGEAARATFVNAPMTGYRGALLNSIPWGHKLVGPVAAWANTPGARSALLRTASPTLPYPATGRATVGARSSAPSAASNITPAMRRFVESFGYPRGGVGLPAAAEEDEPK